MFKTQFLIAIIILFASCGTSKQYLTKKTGWSLGTEGNLSIIKDTVNNKKYYYNVLWMDSWIGWEIPIELFSLPVFGSAQKEKEELKTSDLNAFTKSVLKEVGFNIKTDTLYFLIRGNIIAFSSPQIDMEKVTNFIPADTGYGPDFADPPVVGTYKGETLDKDDILRTIYYKPKQKRYLIKDCFQVKNGYLNFVYIFQSKTKKNSRTNPREWCTMWDVTSPQRIFQIMKLEFRQANLLSVKNKLAN